jgi:hypothetical protein
LEQEKEMRAREFIFEEQTWTPDQKSAIPHVTSVGVPGLSMGPTNFYHKYRLGVDMAGSPDPEHIYPTDGQFADDMVMVGYSEADRQIIAHSIKKFGYKPKDIAKNGSREADDTYITSPVSDWNKKK